VDLNQIRSFLAVTQTLNFTSAAKQNGVPQSTISRQISDLETQLGVKLFYRTTRDVQLTEEGRAFLPYALEMTEAEKRGASAVRQLRDGAQGRLSVAAVASAGAFLSDCLYDFGRKYPDVAVDIACVSGGDALLSEGQDPYDFHFLHADMLPPGEAFDAIPTHTDQLCLIARAGRDITLADLPGERFILLSENESPILYMLAMDFFRSRRFSPNIAAEPDSVRAVLLAVSAGLGVTILPSALARAYLPERLSSLPLDIELGYAAAWKRSLLNPAARLFLEVVREKAGK